MSLWRLVLLRRGTRFARFGVSRVGHARHTWVWEGYHVSVGAGTHVLSLCVPRVLIL